MTLDSEQTRADDDEPPIDPTTTFELLANERRRVALHVLDERGPMAEQQLVDALTVYENGEDYTEQERKRLLIAWGQSHASRLEDNHVVVRGQEDVALGRNAPVVLQHIRDGYERQRVLREV